MNRLALAALAAVALSAEPLTGEDAEVVRKNPFLPALPATPAPEAPDPALPTENALLLTGIVQIGEQKEVLVEDRRRSWCAFLKVGDRLGEGVIAEIGRYHVTVRERAARRRIGLGCPVASSPLHEPPGEEDEKAHG